MSTRCRHRLSTRTHDLVVVEAEVEAEGAEASEEREEIRGRCVLVHDKRAKFSLSVAEVPEEVAAAVTVAVVVCV